jgi:hypothetical protein
MISKDPEGLLPGIPSFKKKFVDEVFEGDRYDHDHIINLDETSITRDAPPDYTLEKKGVKTVLPAAMGSEKTSYTTALSVTLNDEKLRAVLIWPGTVTKFKKVSVPENLQQKGHQNTESLGGQVRLGKEFPKRRLLMDGKYLMSIDMRCGKFVSDYFYIKS